MTGLTRLGSSTLACAWLGVCAALGCGEAGPDEPAAGVGGEAQAGAEAVTGAECDPATEVFPVVCATSVCHDGAVNGLDLIAPGVDARLLDAPAAGISCEDSGLRIVDSQDVERSLLLLKLSEEPPCGLPMPLGSGPAGLTDAQLGCIDGYVRRLAR